MKTWDQLATRVRQGFESSTTKTTEFTQFARQFKAFIKSELERSGAQLVSFHAGHFNCYGYYQMNDRLAYFSLPDVRHGDISLPNLMFRTASSVKDCGGGTNNFTELESGATSRLLKGWN